MKILGLVASARKTGNSEILVKAMMSFLPDSIEKEMIRLTDLDIKECRACYACLSEGKNCIIPDDLTFLLDKIQGADAVIIASPCYFLGSHTSIKKIGDRLISLLADSLGQQHKKCITAVTYGIPGWEGYAPEAVNNFARFLHLDVVGTLLVQAASPGEVIRPEILSQAKELVQKLLASPAPTSEPMADLVCEDCGSRLLQLSATGAVRCVMCGSAGNLFVTPQGYSIKFAAKAHSRFSASGLAEHGALLQEIKVSYMNARKELAERRRPYSDDSLWVQPD